VKARLVALKLLRLVPVLFLVTLATFFLLELVPGDPVLSILGADAQPEDYERIREALNLDAPFLERYFDWLGGVLTGDLGEQLTRQGFSVTEGIQQAFPVTLQVAAVAMAISLIVSIPLGVYASYHSGRPFDKFSSGSAFAIISVPSFLAGLLLIFFFVFNPDFLRYPFLALGLAWALWLCYRWYQKTSEQATDDSSLWLILAGLLVAGLTLWIFTAWPSFDRQGFARITSDEGIRENLRDTFLPALTVALTEIAVFMRLLRSDMMATLQEDFILASRAKGLSTRRILFRHALRPSSFSLITLSGVAFGRLIGGTVIVETIFRLRGMGSFIVTDGVNKSDYTVVQGGVLVLATVYVLLNTTVDIAYNYLDPRIRRGRR